MMDGINGGVQRTQERKLYGCWLNDVPGIGNRTIEKLLDLCGDERAVYEAGEAVWQQVLNKRQLVQMRDFARSKTPKQVYEELEQLGIAFVMREEDSFPKRLREIPDPPYALYVKGRLPDEDRPSVAVVGARDCSEYGRFVANGIGKVLGQYGIQVISGMARGVDGISQRAALEAGGSSYGVLGCGVDVCYPAANRELYESLCVQGGVLSLYPPGTEARPGNFPPRNRIVSGLADVLIVVEARAKSGTLITVDMALEQGKDVYVVPGRITDRLSDGCNKLLKQGADVFLSPEEFVREVWDRWSHGPTGSVVPMSVAKEGDLKISKLLQFCPDLEARGLDEEHREVYGALGFDPLTVGQIQEKITRKLSLSKVLSLLMGLCAQGLASQVSLGYFVRKGQN